MVSKHARKFELVLSRTIKPFHVPKAGVEAELPKAGVDDAPNAGVEEPVGRKDHIVTV